MTKAIARRRRRRRTTRCRPTSSTTPSTASGTTGSPTANAPSSSPSMPRPASTRTSSPALKRTLPASGGSASDYDISPDGKEICFTAESAKELGMDYNLDLYVMPIDTSRERKRADEPEEHHRRQSGERLRAGLFAERRDGSAFSRQTTKFFYADRVRIMRARSRAEGKNHEADREIRSYSCTSRIDGRPGQPGLAFEAEDKGYVRLCHPHAFDARALGRPITTDIAIVAQSY